MSTYDTELSENLIKNELGTIDSNPADYYFDILNEKFPILGTQIAWNKVNVFYKKLESKLDFNECIEYLKKEFLKKENNQKVIYIGDSLTENAYDFFLNDIDNVWDFVIEIPHHHYFIHPKGNWCVSVNMTDDFNFGFAVDYISNE